MRFPKNVNTRSHFFEVCESGKKLILFGAGRLCMRSLNTFLRGREVRYICDNNPRLQGTRLFGIDIVPPARLRDENPDDTMILITSGQVKEIIAEIESIAAFDYLSANVLMSKVLTAVALDLFEHKEELVQAEALLCDEMSKHIFIEAVYRRLVGDNDFADLELPEASQYILPAFFSDSSSCVEGEIIIDCGAYTGDSLHSFVEVFECTLKKYYAFEPTPETRETLIKKAHQYSQRAYAPQIVVMPYGVSDKPEVVDFYVTNKPDGSFIIQSKEFVWHSERQTIETVRLDDVIPADEKITLIKMDVEGSEYPALIGAEKIIKTHKPRLGISIYHRGDDYYRIALLIKKWVPEYQFAVRHHTKSHFDTVLYAWV